MEGRHDHPPSSSILSCTEGVGQTLSSPLHSTDFTPTDFDNSEAPIKSPNTPSTILYFVLTNNTRTSLRKGTSLFISSYLHPHTERKHVLTTTPPKEENRTVGQLNRWVREKENEGLGAGVSPPYQGGVGGTRGEGPVRGPSHGAWGVGAAPTPATPHHTQRVGTESTQETGTMYRPGSPTFSPWGSRGSPWNPG